eukprot:TRINITY_DN68159_c0_g1_i1.p1 TRINITY_DN68159_c0_g1~~TRINITY_DN68159_c0_g1_i1.p1  ORF type:complete len:980 (-),score=234.70 TRINITY_DN68159_c0_g1_i1:31-2970(-)
MAIADHQQQSSSLSKQQQRKKKREAGRHASAQESKVAKYELDAGDSMEGAEEQITLQRMFIDESQLFSFMHQVNEIYLDHLNQPPPFARYILLGLQSTGKSTIVERLLKFPMNIVAEGTGTRCPLYVTCIYDKTVNEAECELSGCERCAQNDGGRVKLHDVFTRVTAHNKDHVDSFSKDALRLKVKSKHVQNMFFVDLPGIITTKGQGDDKREAIKEILRTEIKVPNTKLLVLLEPKEYSTNSIVDFLDETLRHRNEWLPKSLFLMTKFDRRTGDSLTGGKSNRFLDEYWSNSIKPFMVITPTMQRSADTMKPEEQYKERQRLLDTAADFEKKQFEDWKGAMSDAFHEDPNSEDFGEKFLPYIGYPSAVTEMNRLLLEDTRARLPQVLRDLTHRCDLARNELENLRETSQFTSEGQIQLKMAEVLDHLVTRIKSYLDGSLLVAHKLPQHHQTLDDEVTGEEESDWAHRPLNHLNEVEDKWREHIADMAEGNWPKSVQADGKFLGGKQYQRALQFFKSVMIDRLPDPHKLRPYVMTSCGHLRGGLSHEDWEHATVEIIKTCVRSVSESGINFFVKHVLYIFRQLLRVAFEDVRHGEQYSSMFKHLPSNLEQWIFQKYDEMVWSIGSEAARRCHISMEPYYSTVNPSLPTLTERHHEAPQLKGNWSSFSGHLNQHGIPKLYHFTDKRNWKQIERLGGLYSWHSLEKQGHHIPAPGGNTISRAGDKKHGMQDFVHLSFCESHPMLHAAQQDGRIDDCFLLSIDPIVVTWKDTVFADRNATDSNVRMGKTLADLQSVQLATTKKAWADVTPEEKAHHQAEVMVLKHIPLQYLRIEKEVSRQKSAVQKLTDVVQSQVCAPAKISMKTEAENIALRRTEFLPAARAKMICGDEVDVILDRSYEYIVGLFRFVLVSLEFQFNHFMFVEFKQQLTRRMGFELVSTTNWKELAKSDPRIAARMEELEKQVQALTAALALVRNIQAQAP